MTHKCNRHVLLADADRPNASAVRPDLFSHFVTWTNWVGLSNRISNHRAWILHRDRIFFIPLGKFFLFVRHSTNIVYTERHLFKFTRSPRHFFPVSFFDASSLLFRRVRHCACPSVPSVPYSVLLLICNFRTKFCQKSTDKGKTSNKDVIKSPERVWCLPSFRLDLLRCEYTSL